jgi:WD40 repeat protein
MDTKIEDHTNFITDIRFKTNSTQLATSSSDGTVRLWNAADVIFSIFPFHLFILVHSNSYSYTCKISYNYFI